MPADAIGDGRRYWAFISYSHIDAAFGRHLHRRLERYVLPRRLVGRVTSQGVLPRRLAPIFRDRDELPAAKDLSAEVQTALSASRALIVVCSPAAAASRWVSREVEVFRSLHPDRPVLAALIDGNPEEGFPEVLQHAGGDGPVEPLAADFRVTGDGERLALLKLIAGLAGVGLDEIVQRDAQRRMQRVMAVTAASLTGVIAMGALTAYALSARAEADRQRTEAEGLVEFMLTDLRTTLKGVGRLDAMTAVNERALRYYGSAKLGNLPPDSLERRARILHAMGEDDEVRGDHRAASRKFEEARRTTAALLEAAPRDPARVFDHAQSEFWIGEVAYEQNRFSDAKKAFEAYKELADQLVVIDPNNPKYLREAGYAEGNLCMVALKPPQDRKAALKLCFAALKHMEAAARRTGSFAAVAEDLANRHAWLADAYRANGDQTNTILQRHIQENILDELVRGDPKNMQLRSRWVGLQRILAWLEFESGQKEIALARLRKTATVSDQMITFDPSNKSWAQQRASVDSDIGEILSPQPEEIRNE